MTQFQFPNLQDLLQGDVRYYTAAGAGSVAGGAVVLLDGGITAAAAALVLVAAAAVSYPAEEAKPPVQLFVTPRGDESFSSDVLASDEFFEGWSHDKAYNGGLNQVRIAFHENVTYLPTCNFDKGLEEQGFSIDRKHWADLVFYVNDSILISMYTGDPQAAKEEWMLGDIGNLAAEMEVNPAGDTLLMMGTIVGCLAPHPSTLDGDWCPTFSNSNFCSMDDIPEVKEDELYASMIRVYSMPGDAAATAFIGALHEGGCGLFLVPIRFYSPDKPSNFWKIVAAARSAAQTAVGFMKDGQVVVNPMHADKEVPIIWAEGDYVLVQDDVDYVQSSQDAQGLSAGVLTS